MYWPPRRKVQLTAPRDVSEALLRHAVNSERDLSHPPIVTIDDERADPPAVLPPEIGNSNIRRKRPAKKFDRASITGQAKIRGFADHWVGEWLPKAKKKAAAILAELDPMDGSKRAELIRNSTS
jgi:hypothetical protein